uniref:E3 ubiquitin protein ligase n=1 Tax=Macrostomum lignano TaxID=282301 RepID=A0A1I8G6L6_9PLAT
MSKREHDDPGSDQPPKKRALTHVSFEPVKFSGVHSLEDLDTKVLQIQNKRLTDRLEERRKTEESLRDRIEQLERRQTKDDELVCIINRYWNQLDEDVRLLLTRFEGESAALDEDRKSGAAESFLKQLGTWDNDELNGRLRQRVEFSTRAIARLVGAFDRLQLRCQSLRHAVVLRKKIVVEDLAGAGQEDEAATAAAAAAAVAEGRTKVEEQDTEDPTKTTKPKQQPSTLPSVAKSEPTAIDDEASLPASSAPLDVDETLRAELESIHAENARLHQVNTSLQERLHTLSLRALKLEEQVQLNEESSAEWRNKHDDSQYNLERSQHKVHRLEKQLAEAVEEIKRLRELGASASVGDDQQPDGADSQQQQQQQQQNRRAGGNGGNIAKSKYRELASELEEQRELANSRLAELESLQSKLDQRVRDCEKLRMDLRELPDTVITETPVYQVLKSNFNLLYSEALLVRSQLQKSTHQVQENRQAHLRQIELMESNELACQTQMRNEMVLMEQQSCATKQELESLKYEMEQLLAQNEQALSITNEMRALIGTLQDQNKHLKSEIMRHRKKSHALQADSDKYRSLCRQMEEELMKLRGRACGSSSATTAAAGSSSASAAPATPSAGSTKPHHQQQQKPQQPSASSSESSAKDEAAAPVAASAGPEAGPSGANPSPHSSVSSFGTSSSSSTAVQNLKIQLKKSQDKVKELAQLLEAFKSLSKDQRDRATISASEARLRTELEESRAEAHRLRDRERKLFSENDLARKVRRLEETLHHCQQKLNTSKQEEDALLKEMEVMELAFSDVQEQNQRLMKQLKEKDDANLKLMNERQKGDKMRLLLQEEKDVLANQLRIIGARIEAQSQVVQKLEEKDRLNMGSISTLEKEVGLRQQALDIFKRRSAEHQQQAQDLQLNLDKYLSQVRELQAAVQEKAAVIEKEGFRHKRLLEELATLKRKHDRLKKIEESSNADEVLLAEIADYKEQLTCPCCKVRRKDAILTKCFHVFCLDCLKTRYETRNRKCPKCNATFGANDYHRIYLA